MAVLIALYCRNRPVLLVPLFYSFWIPQVSDHNHDDDDDDDDIMTVFALLVPTNHLSLTLSIVNRPSYLTARAVVLFLLDTPGKSP